MKTKRILLPLLAAIGMTFAGAAAIHGPDDRVKPNFSHIIPNIPGKSLVALEVSYPPGGTSLPHRHAHSAFIYAMSFRAGSGARWQGSRNVFTPRARASMRNRERII